MTRLALGGRSGETTALIALGVPGNHPSARAKRHCEALQEVAPATTAKQAASSAPQGLVWAIPAHRLAFDDDRAPSADGGDPSAGYSVRAPDFGGDDDRPRSEIDDGRQSIAMPVRLEDRVLGCIDPTWRRQIVSLTGLVQRHLGDLQTAAPTMDERARAAGLC